MSVIDFHSHVLPRIDDGSHSSEESLGMLQISASQGIDVMAATSHFYATEDRISSFLNRRRCSEERLKERMNQELTKEERIPRLIMGAEVAFFTGISRAERLEELTYEGTDLLLLEMPFTKWNKSEIEEVRYILERRKLRVMLAHLERFLMIPGNKKRIYELMELPVYVQINAGSFERWGERRQILKMMGSTFIDKMDTRILNINVVSTDPKSATDIANTLMDVSVDYLPKTMSTNAPNVAQKAN